MAHLAFPVGTRNSILYRTDGQYVTLCTALPLEPRLRKCIPLPEPSALSWVSVGALVLLYLYKTQYCAKIQTHQHNCDHKYTIYTSIRVNQYG